MPDSSTGQQLELPINAGRLCYGLSRIGYTPSSAVCDIVDNSVRAKADRIDVLVRKARDEYSDNRRNNVSAYLIIDDGDGMDADGLAQALTLGASDSGYEKNSLSKFGLGLKTAAFSQGDRLDLISSPGGGSPFLKRSVSLPEVEEAGTYFASVEELTEDDQTLIDEYLPGGKGTIVRVGEVRRVNHPSVRSTIDELRYKAGVIYYYFMRDDNLELFIEGEKVEPFDVLATDEADEYGNLDEDEWDGKTVRWIQKPKDILLDAEEEVMARIEVTQLPHPPTFELEEKGKAKATRDQYRIEAGNYGYYVYRNKRLISWAERFGTIVPLNQKHFSFRGRILIDETADEAFNIDVKKSDISLSDEAERALDDKTADYRRKSREAWVKAAQDVTARTGEDPNQTANEIAEDFEPEEDSGTFTTPEEERERKAREEALKREMREKAREEAARKKSEETGEQVSAEDVTEEEVTETVRGEANPAARRIFRVERLDDDVLWKPYHDADLDKCVRVNRHHRFGRLIYDNNSENTDLQILFDLLLLQLANGEVRAVRQLDKHKREDVEEVLAAYRRYVSNYLAELCRELENRLPPF